MSPGPKEFRLILPGRERNAHPDVHLSDFLTMDLHREVDIFPAARGQALLETSAVTAAGTDVVELEYQGGLREWISVSQFKDDLESHQKGFVALGGDGFTEIRVPTHLTRPELTRGITDKILTGMKILPMNPVSGLADLGVNSVIQNFEGKLRPQPGLYRVSDLKDFARAADPLTRANPLDGTAPILLLLHGTASSVEGSFGGLAGSGEWQQIINQYGGRVLALQHYTLTQSPIENALAAGILLPEGVELHILSHSRGGLIGELLCLDSGAQAFSDFFDGDPVQQTLLRQLTHLLTKKSLNVTRFVRIACPARGTLLASRRLDLYLSVLLNLIGLVPPLAASPLYAFTKATLLELASRRTDPKELPGLEAMMPESPLIALLNNPNLRSKADLAVISGDLAASGTFERLKALALDAFFQTANDLVVNTNSMYGGMDRRKSYYFFAKGAQVNHFNYFVNRDSRKQLGAWLQAAPNAEVDGFRQYTRATRVFTPTEQRGMQKRVLFLIPGLMGTTLQDDGKPLWIDSAALTDRGLERLQLSNTGVSAGAVLVDRCIELLKALESDYEIALFPYDWRRSAREAAAALAVKVAERLQASNRPVHFLALGEGGLIVRAMMQLDDGAAGKQKLWTSIRERGGRLIMVGTPNRGSVAAARLLLPQYKLNRLLRMADARSKLAPSDLFQQFPGVLELVPVACRAPGWWQKTEAARPPDFEGVEDLAASLAGAVDSKGMAYIGGWAEKTAISPRSPDTFNASAHGDGRVSYAEGPLDDVPTWYAEVPHGDLANHPAVIKAVRELLRSGMTSHLPSRSPAPAIHAASPEDGPTVSDTDPVLFPTEDDLIDAALGSSAPLAFAEPAAPIRVFVTHGHLRQARFPVMVGHYLGDSIVSAEKIIDATLGGRLAARFQMGMYPGIVGSSEVILDSGKHPPGVLIIGLDAVGELTPDKLRTAVASGAIRYAVEAADRPAANQQSQTLALTSLLIGTYGGNTLPVRDSISSIITGVLEANRKLKAQGYDKRVRIDAVEIIEISQGLAVDAAHELIAVATTLNGESPSGELVKADGTLRELDSGQIYRPSSPYSSGWWRRISITADGDIYRYVVLTDRARADVKVQTTRHDNVVARVKQSITSTTFNVEESVALFQYLVPKEVQGVAKEAVNLALILDSKTAALPWELLAFPTLAGAQPMATQCGLIRQFASSSDTKHPSASTSNALVIGNPQKNLNGARGESLLVADLLGKRGYRVEALIEQSADITMRRLVVNEYRIIHLAGHGFLDPADHLQSGVLLDGGRLTIADLTGLRAAPDLVFVNCCFLGEFPIEAPASGPSNQLAVNFAEAFINMGARAVVAAGWAVHDGAAAIFARELYTKMLQGEKFGQAVLSARKATESAFPGTNTWGAYQCYGNPDFRLVQPPSENSQVHTEIPAFVARSEALGWLRTAVADILTGNLNETSKATQKLQAFHANLPPDWRDGEMMFYLGEGYRELGDFPSAISSYSQSLLDERSRAPVKAVQQLANVQLRYARKLPKDDPKAQHFIAESARHLAQFEQILKTSEQYSLLGSYYKKLAELRTTGRQATLETALGFYEQAYATRSATGDVDFYSGLNAATLAFLVGMPREKKWDDLIKDCSDEAARQADYGRGFWAAAGLADAAFVQALWENDLPARLPKLSEAYIRLLEAGGTNRMYDSVFVQLETTSGLLDPQTQAGTLAALTDLMETLVQADWPRLESGLTSPGAG